MFKIKKKEYINVKSIKFNWSQIFVYNKYTCKSNSLSSADENWLEKVSHEIHDNRVIMNIHDSKVFKILPGIVLVIGSYLYTVVTKQMGAAFLLGVGWNILIHCTLHHPQAIDISVLMAI